MIAMKAGLKKNEAEEIFESMKSSIIKAKESGKISELK